MHTAKYKIWDNDRQAWFTPTYAKNREKLTEEIVFSQSGEMFMHTIKEPGAAPELVLIPENTRFTPLEYTGIRDDSEKRIYNADVIQTAAGFAIVVKREGCWCVDWIETPNIKGRLLSECGFFNRIGSSMEDPRFNKKLLQTAAEQ